MIARTAWMLTLGTAATGALGSEPEWDDIRPIVERRCASCHFSGGPAGFALLEPRHFRPRRRQVENALRSGEMPPWLPRGSSPDFVGDRRLEPGELDALIDWLEAGTPGIESEESTPAKAPESSWQLGPPDLVIRTETVVVPAAGNDVFRNLVSPVTGLEAPTWVRAIEIRPSSPEVVHHVVLTVDETPSSRRLDAADPQPGFSGMETASNARSPGGSFVGWTPGKSADPGRAEVAWRLAPHADFVALLHLLPSGTERSVGLEIGVHFAEEPPTKQPVALRLGSMSLEIREGVEEAVVRDRFELPVTARLTSVYPHAHYLARRLEAWALLPTGERMALLEIPAWDFHWQDQYRLAAPVTLPAGTTLEMRYSYSAATPPRTVRFGPSSFDEMADLWLELFAVGPDDRRALETAAREHQLSNAETGLRQEVARFAESAETAQQLTEAYFRLAGNLLQQRKSSEATEALEAALDLDAQHVGALTNLGNLRLAEGDLDGALSALERAAALEPESGDALFNVANAHLASGDAERALHGFDAVLQRTPERDGAWLNRGIALHRSGRLEAAIDSFRRAASIEPGNVAAWINLAWTLLAVEETLEARQAFERARKLLPDDGRLDALAEAVARAER
ncbi:MAG: tetratricopeptide repeat protein [Acidobacteriota bacterium]